MTIEQALAWADQTMNERLREARRTGNDHDYDAAMEGCIDILAAEVRRLREALGSIARNTYCDCWQEAALVARAALDTPAREGGET